MASMLKYIVYILHFVVHEDALIDWDKIISNEISFQLGGLRKTQKIYVTFYLVYDISYYHIFEYMPRVRSVDFKVKPISILYPT